MVGLGWDQGGTGTGYESKGGTRVGPGGGGGGLVTLIVSYNEYHVLVLQRSFHVDTRTPPPWRTRTLVNTASV
jgi:hypothetical protein